MCINWRNKDIKNYIPWNFIAHYFENSKSAQSFRMWGRALDVLLSPVGRVVLYIKYREKNIRDRVKQTEYNNSYGTAGKIVTMQILLAALGLVLIFVVYALISGQLAGC